MVPGASVGRLPFDIAIQHPNIEVLTNEENLSLYYANNFILQNCKIANEYTIYPRLSDLKNKIFSDDAMAPSTFPDVINKAEEVNLTIAQCSFPGLCKKYLDEESVDCVLTHFVLDTAHNVVEYISLVEKILKKDGVWINIGGLSYMYEHLDNEKSIELSYETLKGILIDFGFMFMKNEILDRYEYSVNHSKVKQMFNCPCFVVCKGGLNI